MEIKPGKLILLSALMLAGILILSMQLWAQDSGSEAGSDPNSPNNQKVEQSAEPNEPAAKSDEETDPFNLKTSSLISIQRAYENIFTPQLITHEGLVDYATLRRKRQDLKVVTKELESLNPAILMSMAREDRIAFWINTYNACTLKLIVDRYPIEPKWYMILYPNNSIMQIPSAWTKEYFNIQGLEYPLKEIEQGFLLERYKDPRICFALSYASIGGANLRNEPYQGDKLDRQLDEQTKTYIRSPKGMRLDKDRGILHLSNLFQMHTNTFLDSKFASVLKFRNRKPQERAWLNFILPYLDEVDANYLEKQYVTIEFIDYDWRLNELAK